MLGRVMKDKSKEKILQRIIYLLIVATMTLPSIIITLYAYPVQDDFGYAYHAKETMKKGHGLLYTSFAYTIKYYKTFCGCYTSSFWGYFFPESLIVMFGEYVFLSCPVF